MSLVTGFLGSGKTTLVNRLLTEQQSERVAVVTNEFGELGIDADLVVGKVGHMVELANGCLCCATQGDLTRSLADILRLRDRLDSVVIETSGLADPVPVAETILRFGLGDALMLDAVVTVVDAANFDRNLESAPAAYQQLICADLLLVNKVDLVDEEIPGLIERNLRRVNPEAAVLPCVRCDVPVDVVVGVGGGRATRVPHAHASHDFESVGLTVAEPLDRSRFEAWLDSLPEGVLRGKGFVAFADRERTYTYHQVGRRRTLTDAPYRRRSRREGTALVLIGRALEPDALAAGLRACTPANEGIGK